MTLQFLHFETAIVMKTVFTFKRRKEGFIESTNLSWNDIRNEFVAPSTILLIPALLQGDKDHSYDKEMAVTLKRCTSDSMLVKPKCI